MTDTGVPQISRPKARTKKMSLSTLILLSYVGAICAGAGLLMLPFSTESGIALIDALFTSTSAVCVTGLTVVDTGTVYTVFGQFIVMLLIQIGGLGVMTFSVVFFLYLGKRISFRHRMIMQEVFAHTPRQDIYRVVKSIFVYTFLVEGAGALSLFLLWIPDHSLFDSIRLAVFHAVSAFCNAGFGLFPDNFMSYRNSAVVNLTICGLIVLGGIGFPVVYDVSEQYRKNRKGRVRFSVQTKTVLLTTAILIFAGMGLILWTENSNVLLGLPWGEKLWIAFFQSVTTRTAGFNTVDIGQLTNPTLFTMMVLMFWGASPGSTGGGVKTTTLAILSSFTWSRLRRRGSVNLFKKSVPQDTLTKSISLVVLSLAFIFTIFFLVLLTQEHLSEGIVGRGAFAEYLFEVISAFGTVGLSTGVTPTLNVAGKLLIILMMLIGRVGVLTFTYIFAGVEPREGIRYAEQNLMIG